MLRAVRFGAQLGFSIEDETREAIVSLAPNIAKVSAERIQIEMVKLSRPDIRNCCARPMRQDLPQFFCRNLTR